MKHLAIATVFTLLVTTGFSAHAEKLRIAVGLSIPPYVIKEENRGIEFDILKESLAFTGYEMDPVYVPLGRTLDMLKKRQVDGIMSTGDLELPGCYTEPHITYWNFAISLKEKNLTINSVDDLKGHRVLSFQNARNYLGDAFKKMAEANDNYREIANQCVQNKMLFAGRIDVVVADRFIFEWFRKDQEVRKFVDMDQEVVHHPLFEPSSFSAVFVKPAVCERFNKGLVHLQESGRYDEIISSYGLAEPKIAEKLTR